MTVLTPVSTSHRSGFWLAYGLAVILPVATLVGRLSLGYKPGDPPMIILFVLPAIISAYVGGLGPGIAATIISALMSDYFLIRPADGLPLLSGLKSTQWLVLIPAGLLISILAEGLRTSRHRFQALTEHSGDCIALNNAENKILYLSPSVETVEGFTPAELIGRNGMENTHPDDLPLIKKTFAQLMAKPGQPIPMLWRRRHKDGRWLWLEGVATNLLVDPAVRAIVTNYRDVTERMRVEEELLWRTAFFDAQVDSALDGILVVDSAGRKILQNRRMAEVWKIPPEIAEDKDDAKQIQFVTGRTKNSRQFAEKVAYLYSHPAEISRDEIELIDGTVLDRYSAPVRDKGGKYYGRIWTFRDVTENKKAEELVRHLAVFPELNPNPVLEFSDAGALLYHNPAAVGMARKVGFASLEQLLPAETGSIVAECLASGRPRQRLETKHGESTLSWSFYPITKQRVVHCYVGDITDRQSLEGQLRQAQKMEAIGQLAGGVAHDFNNMLTAIIGHLGLLKGNPQVTPEIAESLGEISAAANRAANLTSQLLSFSRRQIISASALDLNEVVSHPTKMLRRILGEVVIMQLDYAPEQLTFHGDAGMMEQLLVNLAVNARDAMPGGGTLRIATRSELRVPPVTETRSGASEPASFVRLSVSDTGTGIPPELRARIFEPFFTTKDVGKGTGLGLATVFGIVQQHHGWIEVESEVGRGTTFHIYLPRLATAPLAATMESPALPARGQGEIILLVEDEPSVQEMGVIALNRQGYRVLTAVNGRQALEVWAKHKDEIALLLTDMIMPEGISGQQLARQLLEEKPALKVVYSSGYNAEIAGKELKLTDGINFLAKPYELERLFRTVRAALDSKRSRPPF